MYIISWLAFVDAMFKYAHQALEGGNMISRLLIIVLIAFCCLFAKRVVNINIALFKVLREPDIEDNFRDFMGCFKEVMKYCLIGLILLVISEWYLLTLGGM